MNKISGFLITATLGLFLLFMAGIALGQTVTAGFTFSKDCLDVAFQNTSTSTGGGMTYEWDFGDGTGTTTVENPTYTYDGTGSYTVTLTVTNEDEDVDVQSESISVVETQANFTYSQECDLFHFMNTSNPVSEIDSVYWHFGEGDTVRLYNPPFDSDHAYSGAGIYTVYLMAFADECSDKKSSSVNFTVPEPDYTYTQVVDTFYFQDISTPVGEITSWYWLFGDGSFSYDQNPSHHYAISGSFTVTLEISTAQGCTKVKSRSLVFYIPEAEFTYFNTCGTFQFTDLSSPADSIVSWSWDFGDGIGTSLQQNPVYSYADDGAYKVFLQVNLASGSSDTVSHWVSFYHPDALFSHDPACLGTQTCFFDESIPNSGDNISWHWDYGNGNSSSLQNPCYIYGIAGEYHVTLTVENSIGCITVSEIDTLIVDYPPVADFSSGSACFNELTSFTNLTDTNGIAVISWQWDFGDPASGNNSSSLFEPDHLFTAEGTFLVNLSVENINGCISSTLKSVTVDSIPEALFILPFDTLAQGTIFTITDVSIAHGTPILIRSWDFGDGVTAINPNPVTHIYTEPGNYEICLIVTNLKGCSDTLCQTIVVTGLPHADFNYTLNPNLKVNFFDDSYTESEIKYWYWDFGDPTVSSDTLSGNPNPFYIYPYEGFYPVYLKIIDSYNGIQDTIKTIYVGSAIHTEFETDDVCSGDSVKFYDHSYSNVNAQFLSWYWNFGDSKSEIYFTKKDSISHYYENPGVYDVSLVVTGLLNGVIARDTLINQVHVFNPPVAQIDSENLIACLGQPINFVDSTYTWEGDPLISWDWDFGDGQTSSLQNPGHVYGSIKEYQVVLTVNTEHFCESKDTITAKITIAPDVDFVIDNACVNSPAYFLHTDSDIEITDWLWNFNDPYHPGLDTSSAETPSYIYTHIDIYHVTMEASSYGCKKKVEKSFIVYPIPYSEFSLTSNYTGVQGRTLFNNNSIYATSYLWDFGNGHTSNVEDPIEVFEFDSTYTITLISFNEYGCADTSRHNLTVFFRGLYFPTAFSPNNPNYEISRFMPKGINLREYLVQVFDLKGNLMWKSDLLDEYGSPAESWDGYYNGLLMPEGVYVWKAHGIFRDGTEWKGSDLQYDNPKTNGTVTLIR